MTDRKRFTFGSAQFGQLVDWFRPELPKVGWLGLLGLLNAVVEAIAVISLVPLIQAIGSGSDSAFETDVAGLLSDPVEVRITTLLWICFGALMMRMIGQTAFAFASAKVVSSYQQRMRIAVAESFLLANWRLQSQESIGRLQSAVGVSVVRSGNGLIAVFKALTSGAAALFLLFSAFLLDWAAASALLVFITVIFFVLRPVTRQAVRWVNENTRMNRVVASQIGESLSLARDYRVFDVIAPIRVVYRDLAKTHANIFRWTFFLRELTPALYQGLASLGLVGAIAILYLIQTSDIAPVVAVALLSVRSFTYGQQLQMFYHRFVESWPFVEDVKESVEAYSSARDSRGDASFERLDKLSFAEVGFEYAPGKPVLHQISFDLERGQSLGVIGPSGGGKSTITQLALGLFQPTSGAVLANETPVTDIAAGAWFDRVGYVPQEPQLIRGTIADNIRFYREAISDDLVKEAAKRASLMNDISGMPEGFQTDVGERGGRLSGGQRQRLIIARALVTSPDLLILDEPTSALDFETDTYIKQTISELSGEVALIVVAHRISSIEKCDRILVIKEGRIEEHATPDELSRSSDYFRSARLAQSS